MSKKAIAEAAKKVIEAEPLPEDFTGTIELHCQSGGLAKIYIRHEIKIK